MSFRPFWLAVAVSELPDACPDGIILSHGFSDSASPESDNLAYAILVRTSAETVADAQQIIADVTREFGQLSSELVADDPSLVVRQERRAAALLKPREALLHSSFVGFKKDCEEAQASAVNIVRLAIQKTWWQFWR